MPFIGRIDEQTALAEAASGLGPKPFAVVVGPGGMGKTALLEQVAAAHGSVVHVADQLPADPEALVTLAQAERGPWLIVDAVDRAPMLTSLLVRAVLPMLDEDKGVLVASRSPLPIRLAAEVTLRRRLLPLALEGLSAEEVRAFLAASNVSSDGEGVLLRLHEVTYGHPLTLALVCALGSAEQLAEEGLGSHPSLVAALLSEVVDAVPAVHRRALLGAAIAYRTDERLLRQLNLVDAAASFEWLRTLSYMRADRAGLYPHALVRDALRADAKWRDRAFFDEVNHQVRVHAVDRFREDHDPEALLGLTHLLSDVPAWERIAVDRAALGVDSTRPATEADLPAVEALLTALDGPEHARWFRYWFEVGAPVVESRVVEEDDGEVSAFIQFVVLPFDGTGVGDPAADELRRHLQQERGLESGTVLFGRFWCHRDRGQHDPYLATQCFLLLARRFLAERRVDFVVTANRDPERWVEMAAISDDNTIPTTFHIDGAHYALVVHDFRFRDLASWMGNYLFGQVSPPGAPVLLDRDVFEREVREALRTMGRSLRPSDSPLLDTPLVRQRAADPNDPQRRVESLVALLVECIESLTDERTRSVLRATYVDPAPKQRAAAFELGLSYATYRRVLARGVDEVCHRMWTREVSAAFGPPADAG